ncbi:MAG TPA: hypothetical protein PK954_05845, partial [Anaerolineales bacterium]|nr:hypothetical protein [Anaerolineales bacterium]
GYQPVPSYPITTGFVGVGNFEHRMFWEYRRVGDSDVLRTFAHGDIDGDGQAEVALGGDYAFEVNALGTQTAQISYVTLPSLRK